MKMQFLRELFGWLGNAVVVCILVALLIAGILILKQEYDIPKWSIILLTVIPAIIWRGMKMK